MITVAQAHEHILSAITPLSDESVPLIDAVDRVLALPFTAQRRLPAWDQSAMDGYAVRGDELQAPRITLKLVDSVAAGDTGERPIQTGEAARIFTGAPLPPGTDTVMIQENALRSKDGDSVSFSRAAQVGENVRRAGTDTEIGAEVLSAGRCLMPGDINLVASQGVQHIQVIRRPRVHILSSGSELVELGHIPAPGQVINSNAIALAAAVRQVGGVPTILPILPDDAEQTRQTLQQAIQADMLITVGGMSVGDYDFMRDGLRDITGDGFSFWKVAMKPGKPLGFGHAGPCAVFGLPGNPVSATVTFEIFVKPALKKLQGHKSVLPPPAQARLDAPIAAGGTRQNYLRAKLVRTEQGIPWVRPLRTQSSGSVSSIAGADALVIVPVEAPERAAGEWVDVHWLVQP